MEQTLIDCMILLQLSEIEMSMARASVGIHARIILIMTGSFLAAVLTYSIAAI